MIPILQNNNFAKEEWIYTWIVAPFSLISSSIAIAFHLVFSVEWSTLLAAASSIAQAFVALQLMCPIAE
jgi:hypothetical protein